MHRIKQLHLLIAAFLVVLLGCGRDERMNVLIVTFDTTRADRMGCYGYREPSSPTVDGLAAEGTLFEQAFCTNPITLPSHTSIMTGTYPIHHGARDNTTFVVREDVTTLAERLQAEGYDTGAFVAAFVLDSQFNLDQGFTTYNDRISENWSKDELDRRARDAFGFAERKANLVTKAAVDWVKQDRSEPFFMWVHYFDPHQPIDPPEPHQSRFSEAYAAEIAFADEQLGYLLGELKKRGEYDNTIVVVTSDHGEGLMDHGEPSHSLLIFDSTMHVPLVIKAPGGVAGQRVAELASTVDVAPTVLDLLDLDPLEEAQGISLADWVRGEGVPPRGDRQVYMETLVPALQCGWGALRGLRTKTEKLIHGPVPRYYEVDTDPGEIYDRARHEPEAVQRMTEALAGRLELWGAAEAQDSIKPPSAEALAKLRDLGYVGGGGAALRGITDTLDDVAGKDDPHELHLLFDRMGVATENLRTGFEREGLEQLQSIIAADPDNPAALTNLGKAYYVSFGDPLAARPYFERSIEADPQQEEALFFLARTHRGLGEYDEAKLYAESILEFNPHSLPGLMELSGVYEGLGHADSARAQLQKILDTDPTSLPALLAMGTSYGNSRNAEQARHYLQKALNIEPNSPQILYNVAMLHLLEEDKEEAVASLVRALRAAPADPQTAYMLGELMFQTGDTRAEEVLQRARQLVRSQERIDSIDRMLGQIQQ